MIVHHVGGRFGMVWGPGLPDGLGPNKPISSQKEAKKKTETCQKTQIQSNS